MPKGGAHGIAHCLLSLLENNVVSLLLLLWRSFVTTELITLYCCRIEESARTLVVLDVDGKKKRFDVKNTHTSSAGPRTGNLESDPG